MQGVPIEAHTINIPNALHDLPIFIPPALIGLPERRSQAGLPERLHSGGPARRPKEVLCKDGVRRGTLRAVEEWAIIAEKANIPFVFLCVFLASWPYNLAVFEIAQRAVFPPQSHRGTIGTKTSPIEENTINILETLDAMTMSDARALYAAKAPALDQFVYAEQFFRPQILGWHSTGSYSYGICSRPLFYLF